MSPLFSVRRALLALFALVLAFGTLAEAQTTKQKFEPEVGQEGKDVVWVPTPDALVEKMLDMADVTVKDYVIDLGSGDGRTVIAAAKRGARALGVEFNPDMVELAKRNAEEEGVSSRAKFVQGDLYEADLSDATVITLFLLPEINLALRPQLLRLRPGTRIVSNTFTMGEWATDDEETVDEDECDHYCTALLWIVPARAEGTWKFEGGEINLEQEFQMVSGTVTRGGKEVKLSRGRLLGHQLTFRAGGAEYSARVTGKTMKGTVTLNGKTESWTATRVAG
jgi:SAM-dependent methyltransferase